MKYLQNLNAKQKEAVMDNSKYIRVIAGAGSGKTRVLTSRIIRLYNDGINHHNILGITFTNKAAKEMKNRIISLVEPNINPNIFTFHSYCVKILREDGNEIGYGKDFNIIDEEDKTKLLKEILKEKNIDKEYIDYKAMISFISYIKTYYYNKDFVIREGFSSVIEKDKYELYKVYESKLMRMRSLDFDDLLLKVYKLFNANEEILNKWQNRCKHVLVDEYQDTNDLQFEIVKQLVGKENNLFVVGDPDQTIYTWRGANLKVIMDFERYFKDAKTIVLDKNYRSTKKILTAANLLIKNNKNRVYKDLITDNDDGEEISYFHLETQKEEAYKVVELIKKRLKENNLNYKDVAVLYRANYLSREIEMALVNYGISYKIFGGVRFYERKEIKDALSYLKILVNKDDDISFLRAINEPKRGIGDVSLDKLKKISTDKNISMYASLKENFELMSRNDSIKSAQKFIELIDKYTGYLENVSLSVLLENLLNEVGYYKMLHLNDEEERKENIKELINNILYFENNSEEPTLINFLQEIALYSAQDEVDDGNYVSLMTVHTAKGLEYQAVFVIGLNEGVFPSSRSILEREGEEEERRLAYVAFTRAKKYLHLSCNSDYSYVTQGRKYPSRFLQEIVDVLPGSQKSKYKNVKKDLYNKNENRNTGISNNIEWSIQDKVNHVNFGQGVVVGLNGKFISVAFKDPSVGVKNLLSSHCSISKI